jgi:hypothetical protein
MQVMRKNICGLFLLFLVMGCSSEDASVARKKIEVNNSSWLNSEACRNYDAEGVEVSIADLISNPAQFEGKNVKVNGFYYSGFEHSAIYPSRRDPATSSWNDGLWVYGLSAWVSFNNKRVTLSGVFSAKRKGHLGQWPGSICISASPTVDGFV